MHENAWICISHVPFTYGISCEFIVHVLSKVLELLFPLCFTSRNMRFPNSRLSWCIDFCVLFCVTGPYVAIIDWVWLTAPLESTHTDKVLNENEIDVKCRGTFKCSHHSVHRAARGRPPPLQCDESVTLT